MKAIALFATPLQNQFAAWAFEYVAEGADVGEIEAIANDVASEDDAAYYDAWYEHATRHRAKAEEAEAQGKTHTALYHHLRAAVYASVSYKLLFGAPVDPRLATAFETQTTSFDRAMALIEPPAEPLDVTLDGNRLVVYFLRAKDAAPGEPRPTIVMVNGYDASVSDMYLAMGLQALPRGYHVVLVDGPGQGALLVQDGVPMIAEWERVIGPVSIPAGRCAPGPHRVGRRVRRRTNGSTGSLCSAGCGSTARPTCATGCRRSRRSRWRASATASSARSSARSPIAIRWPSAPSRRSTV